MTRPDRRPRRSPLDRLPLLTELTVLAGLISAVDLWVRLYSRFVGCRPTPTNRGATGYVDAGYVDAELGELTVDYGRGLVMGKASSNTSSPNVVWLTSRRAGTG